MFSDGSSPPRRPGSDGPDGQAVFQKLAKPTTSASKKKNSEIMKLEEKFSKQTTVVIKTYHNVQHDLNHPI